MSESVRIPSHQALIVLGSIFYADPGKLYGQEISKLEGISSGTLYPLLSRLVGEGMLLAETETASPAKLERPARTYYQLSEKGKKYADTYRVILLAAHELNRAIVNASPPLVTFSLFS